MVMEGSLQPPITYFILSMVFEASDQKITGQWLSFSLEKTKRPRSDRKLSWLKQ